MTKISPELEIHRSAHRTPGGEAVAIELYKGSRAAWEASTVSDEPNWNLYPEGDLLVATRLVCLDFTAANDLR